LYPGIVAAAVGNFESDLSDGIATGEVVCINFRVAFGEIIAFRPEKSLIAAGKRIRRKQKN
jgi:hypothetical protein